MPPRALSQFRTLTHILGRREALKYTGIAIAAGMVAPLTGCSGSKAAFAEFAAGTWTVTIPEDTAQDWSTATLTIDKAGTWTFSAKSKDLEERQSDIETSGTWTLEGGRLALQEDDDRDRELLRREALTASSIPQEVNEDEMISSLTWNYGEDDTFDIPVAWEADTKTLTLTGVSGQEGRTTPIVAKKSES